MENRLRNRLGTWSCLPRDSWNVIREFSFAVTIVNNKLGGNQYCKENTNKMVK